MNIKIETERFYLREVIPSDVNEIFELDSNPGVHSYLRNNPITKIEQARKYIEFLNKQYQENGIEPINTDYIFYKRKIEE